VGTDNNIRPDRNQVNNQQPEEATMYDPNNLINDIIAFEEGDIDDDRLLGMFQHLVDTGKAWTLQGFYGRTAIALIEAGHITRPDKSGN
jgi:hypothetical protein